MSEFSNVAPDQCPVHALSNTFHLSNEQLEAVFRKARAESPVVYLDDIDYWAVCRYDDIKRVLGDKEHFSAEITLQPLRPVAPEVIELFKQRGFAPRPTLSNNESDHHAPVRRVAQAAFSPRRNKKLEPYIRQLVNDAVDRFEGDKRADLVAQMVYELPALVLFKLLGIPEEDVQTIKMWADSRLVFVHPRMTCRATCSRCAAAKTAISRSRTSTTSSSVCCWPGTRRRRTCRPTRS
jgi:cytochrome P450